MSCSLARNAFLQWKVDQLEQAVQTLLKVVPWDRNLRIAVDANLLVSWPQGLRRVPEMQPEDLE